MSDFLNVFLLNLSQEMRSGKYLGLVIVSILFLWLLNKYKKLQGTRVLLLYGITSCFLALVPLTGALLAAYQTRFYSYRHLLLLLFSGVFIPWALVEAVETGLGQIKRGAEENDLVRTNPWLGRLLAVLAAACLLMLNGNLITEGVETNFSASANKVPEKVMEVLELLEDGEVLVAPNEVLEYARSYDGNLKLLYGRDMWQPALRAYTYNSYDETAKTIYTWMQNEPLNYFDVPEEELLQMQRQADEEAFALLSGTACSTLVLPQSVYTRVWENLGMDGMGGFEIEEVTTEYVILVRR